MTSYPIYTPKQQRILLITSLLVLGGFIIAGLQGYVSAFFGAGILYVIFRSPFYGLVYRKKWNRTLVITGIILFSLFAIILPFLVLSFLLIDRIQYYSAHTDQILGLVKQVENLTNVKLTSQENIRKILQQGGTLASRQLPSLAGGLLDFLVIIGLMLFTLFYMFSEEETFQEGLRRYLPFKRDTMKDLGEQLRNNVNANVLGQVIVSFVQGILTGLTLWIFGVPDAAFWGTVAFFMAFIPVLGTPLGGAYSTLAGQHVAGGGHFAGRCHHYHQHRQCVANHAGQTHGRRSSTRNTSGHCDWCTHIRHSGTRNWTHYPVVFHCTDERIRQSKSGLTRRS
jgi:predicted PurR-regulated permease PerM